MKKIKVFLAGDSTVADYPVIQSPMAGWGQMLSRYLIEEAAVSNFAVCGRSSKSFVNEGRLEGILAEIQKDDYLFIQFGHNDEKIEDQDRYTEPKVEYKKYLSEYVEKVRRQGAIPILITPVARRRFSETGRIISTHTEYVDSMKELAQIQQVNLIDLSAISEKFFEHEGVEETKKIFLHLPAGFDEHYPNGISDDTHFHKYGADILANIVVCELRAMDIPLSLYIR